MDRRLIENVVWRALRESNAPYSTILDAIALYICRANADKIAQNLADSVGTESFDFEELFNEGAFYIEHLQKTVGKEMMDLLCTSFSETAAVLNEQAQSPKGGTMSIGEGASRFMLGLLKPDGASYVLVPFGGDSHAPLMERGCFFHMEVLDQQSMRFAKLVVIANGPANYSVSCGNPFLDSYEDRPKSKYIYVPAMPFGLRMTGMGRKFEENFVLKMIDALEYNGRMVIALPAIALSSDTYFELRKCLVEKKYLRKVIILGGGLYKTTAIKTAIFVIEKSTADSEAFDLINAEAIPMKNDASFFNLQDKIAVNASDICYPIQYSKLWSSSNLSIRTILDSGARIERPGFKYVKLSDILKPYSNNVEVRMEDLVPRVSGKDMHISLPKYQIDIQDVTLEHLQGRFNCITENVFCFHSITLNNVWCEGEPDMPIYCNQNIFTFTLKDPFITPEYLSFALAEEDIRAELKSLLSGSVIPRVSKRDFLNIEIPYPDKDRKGLTLQEIERFVSDRKTRLSAQSQESQREAIEDIKDDIEDKIHLMGPYNLDIQSGLNRVLKKLENGETLDANTKIFKKSDITLADYLRQLVTKSLSAGYITATIGGNIFEPVDRPMDSFTYLQEYVAYLQSDNAYKGITFSLGPIATPYALMITPRTMNLVLDTIVRNAVMHGFSDSFYGDKRIWINITEDTTSSEAIISIANNGLPADEAFSEDLYERKFGKCGETQHTGRGGYFVSNAMKFYKGRVSVDTTNKEWPFIVKLHIPMSHE